MARLRTTSSRTRLLIVAGLAATGLVGGAAGWAPAAQAGCYGTDIAVACVPAYESPVIVGDPGGVIGGDTRVDVVDRTVAKAKAILAGCDACTPGIVVPIGPPPIGPAGDDLVNTVDGATRTARNAVAELTGCGACTPGIVVPIGPTPIGPAGDDLVNMVEGAVNRDIVIGRR